MKWTLIIALASTSLVFGTDAVPSKGAITEGRFILQNKILSVKKSIQALKKELTECFTVLKPKDSKKDVAHIPDLEMYQCRLKQLLYPSYIDELGFLLKRLELDAKSVGEDKQLSQAHFDAIMKKSFLLTDKIDLEKKLLQVIYAIDTDEQALKELKPTMQKRPETEKSDKFIDLSLRIKNGKKRCSELQSRLNEVNAKLFVGDLIQEVFLDKLAYYSSSYTKSR